MDSSHSCDGLIVEPQGCLDHELVESRRFDDDDSEDRDNDDHDLRVLGLIAFASFLLWFCGPLVFR